MGAATGRRSFLVLGSARTPDRGPTLSRIPTRHPRRESLNVQYAPALYAAGVLADAQLDFDSAEASMNASLEIQRELGDKQGIATLESAMGIISSKAGRLLKPGRMSSDRCSSGGSSAPASSFSA